MATDDCDSNITTDAFPSAPRDENTKKSSEFVEENDPKPPPPLHKKQKSKSKKPTGSVNVTQNYMNFTNLTNVHFGTINNIRIGCKLEKKENKEEVVKTAAIKQLLCRTDKVTIEMLKFVSSNIGNYKRVARNLDYSDPQIQQFELNYKFEGIIEIVYQILLEWTQDKAEKAKVGILCTALWDANEVDVVRKWADGKHTKII